MLRPHHLGTLKQPGRKQPALPTIVCFFAVLIQAELGERLWAADSVAIDVVNVSAAGVADGIATIPIRLSVVPSGDDSTRIKRMVVRLRPRNVSAQHNESVGPSFGHIVDFSPRTQTTPLEDQPVLVRTTGERNEAAGLSVDGVYGSLGSVHGGLDRSDKVSQMVESKRLPTLVASISSGTIDRGSGVQFKLDATSQLVIEGERTLSILAKVGPRWRGGLVDVDVDLHVSHTSVSPSFWDRTFDPIDSESQTTPNVLHQRFVVAVHRDSDPQAAADARRLAKSEVQLRRAAIKFSNRRAGGWRSMWKNTFDFNHAERDSSRSKIWASRVIAGQADPHHDEYIAGLPMNCRTAAIDFVDASERLIYGDTDANATKLASWIAKHGDLSPQ